MADDNLFDVVEQLRTIVADLKRTVYGDPATRSRGLMDEFDGLRADVNALRQDANALRHDIERVKAKRPNVVSWVFGYLLFCAAGLFATVFLISQIGYEVLGLPENVSLGLAILFALGALFLFVSGFGWLDHG